MLFGALEAGGTKMYMAVLNELHHIKDELIIPTQEPDITVPQIIRFFKDHPIDALGVGSFGPLSLNTSSVDYGTILSTPKLSWRNYPIYRILKSEFSIPIAIDTDVNASALAEARLGSGKGKSIVLYVTVGTGIGGGLIINGRPIHGAMHPEIGHMMIPYESGDPAPNGFCPYHRHCLEGLASGPSIEKRWGISAKILPQDHPGWKLEASYLACLCANAVLAYSPDIIILGGGVMHRNFLYPSIRRKTIEMLNGYVPLSLLGNNLQNYIVAPELGDHCGIIGSCLLAEDLFIHQ